MIAKVTLNQWSSVDERVRGIRSVVAKRGGLVEIVGCGGGGFSEVQEAVDRAISENGLPDAVMAITDQMGIAILKLLKAKGFEVPKQVLVTGFNAFEYWRLSDPVLTTVRAPGYELGQVAGREMIRRLETGSFEKRAIKLPVELVIGETT